MNAVGGFGLAPYMTMERIGTDAAPPNHAARAASSARTRQRAAIHRAI